MKWPLSLLVIVGFCFNVQAQVCNTYSYGNPPTTMLINTDGPQIVLPVTAKTTAPVLVSTKKVCKNWKGLWDSGECYRWRTYKVYEVTSYFYACENWKYQTEPVSEGLSSLGLTLHSPAQRCLPAQAYQNTAQCEYYSMSSSAFSGYTGNFRIAYVKLVAPYEEESNEYGSGGGPSSWHVKKRWEDFTEVSKITVSANSFHWTDEPAKSICPADNINFKVKLSNSNDVTYSVVSGGGSVNTNGVYTPGSFTGDVVIRARKSFFNGGQSDLTHSFKVNGLVDIQSLLPASICSDATAINLMDHFNWEGDHEAVITSTTHPASISNDIFNPAFSGTPSTSIDVGIKVAITSQNCTGTLNTTIKVARGGWNIAGVSDFNACTNVSSYPLNATPANGGQYTTSWSGPGISGTTFQPGSENVEENGNNVLRYTANSYGCIKSKEIIVNVSDPSTLSVTNPNVSPSCGATSINLIGSVGPKANDSPISSNIVWSSSNSTVNSKISGNVLNTSGLGLSSYPLSFQYTNSRGCISSLTIPAAIVINSYGIAPPIVATSYACQQGEALLSVTNYDPDADYTWYNAASGGTIVGTGRYFQTPYLTSNGKYWAKAQKLTCESPRTESNVVVQNVSVSAGSDIYFCDAYDAVANLVGTPSGGTWSGPGVTGNVFNGSGLEHNKKYLLSYTYKLNGCEYVASKYAHIGFDVNITVSPDKEAYQSGELITFTHNLAQSDSTIWTVFDSEFYSSFYFSNPSKSYLYFIGQGGVALSVKNSFGCSETFSKPLFVQTPDVITGTDDAQEPIEIFPNPFTNTLTFNGITSETTVDLYDMSGRLLVRRLVQPNQDLIFETSFLTSLKPGIYYVRLVTGKNTTSRKLVKN